MQKVFVLDTKKRPLAPTHPARARQLLKKGKAGIYIGTVAIRTSGSFNLKTDNGTIQGISYRYCHLLQRADGYNYQKGGTALPPTPFNGVGFRA